MGEKGHDDGVGTPTPDRSDELGRFLRSRRARIAPEDVGLPDGPRRRVPGLRREEVAVLAGLSPTWYTYLEQGRPIRPSNAVLDSLVRILGLDPQERQYLYLLALGRAPDADHDATGAGGASGETMTRLLASIGLGPDPVYIANSYGDVLHWNAATVTWFTDFSRQPPDRRNMLWWMLTAPEARERVGDWDEDARDLVGRLRAAYAQQPDDERMNRTIQDLSDASSDFRRWWASQDVSDQRTRLRRLTLSEVGTRTFEVVVLRLADDAGHAVVVHVPFAAHRSAPEG